MSFFYIKTKRFLSFLLCLYICFLGMPIQKAHSSETKSAEQPPLFSVRGIGGGGGFFNPVFSPYNENLMMTVCDMGGVYRSENKGKSWDMIPWHKSPRRAHFSPAPIFLSKNKLVWINHRSTLIMSDDEGLTWKEIVRGPWHAEKQQKENDKRFAYIRSYLNLDNHGTNFLVSSDFGLWKGGRAGFKKISNQTITHLKRVNKDIYGIENYNTLLKSADNGVSWEKTPLPGTITAFDATLDETGQPFFYISVDDMSIQSSIDFGKTWKVRTNDYGKIKEIIIPSGQSSLIFAMEHPTSHNANLPNLVRSVDGGQTWDIAFRMLDSQETFWLEKNVEISWMQSHLYWSYYFTGIAVSPSDPKTLLITTQGEIFISKNAGDTWEIFFSTPLPPGEEKGLPRSVSNGLEVTSVWGYYYDPHETNREYIAYTDIGFAHSLDQGKSWSWSATGSPWTNTFYDLEFDPNIPGKIYAATSNLHDIPHFLSISNINPSHATHRGGVVVSSDFGKTWKVPYNRNSDKGLPNQVCTSVILDPDSDPRNRTLFASIYGESNDNAGVYVSHDNGKTWAPTKGQPGGHNKHIYKLYFHPITGDLYCLITGLRAPNPHYFNPDEGGVWRSTDKGNSWEHLSKGEKLSHWANALAFHPTAPNGLYVASASPQGINAGGIYYSKDGGKRWWHILKDSDISRLRGLGRTYNYDHWMAVLVHPENTDLIFAGATNNGLFFSKNGGKSWLWCKEFPFSNAQSITFNPKNLDEIIVTTFGSGVWSASIKELLARYQ